MLPSSARSANKIARMVWAMMARGERYKEPVALAA
jgi:transposase